MIRIHVLPNCEMLYLSISYFVIIISEKLNLMDRKILQVLKLTVDVQKFLTHFKVLRALLKRCRFLKEDLFLLQLKSRFLEIPNVIQLAQLGKACGQFLQALNVKLIWPFYDKLF